MEIIPFADAVKRLGTQTPIGSALASKEWAGVSPALRGLSVFSSRVESVRFLETLKQSLDIRARLESGSITGDKPGTSRVMGRDAIIRELKATAQRLGIGGGTQSITDIQSNQRLRLIVDMNETRAYEFGRWKAAMREGALDAFPAQEFRRIETREQPRLDWPARWAAAGGEFYEGDRMIALKTDPVWARLSKFGTPWPPFDWGSGMGLSDIGRDESDRLGLTKADDEIEPPPARDLADYPAQASTAGLPREAIDRLVEGLGGKAEYDPRRELITFKVGA